MKLPKISLLYYKITNQARCTKLMTTSAYNDVQLPSTEQKATGPVWVAGTPLPCT